MPSVSSSQHNAMEAAAHGRSTLGIPKKVGQDFAAADKGKTLQRAMAKRLRHKRPVESTEKEPPGMKESSEKE